MADTTKEHKITTVARTTDEIMNYKFGCLSDVAIAAVLIVVGLILCGVK